MQVKGDSDGAKASQATEQLATQMAERGLGDVFSGVFDADLSLASVSVSDVNAANSASDPAGVAMATDAPGIAGAQNAPTDTAAAETETVDTFSVSLDMEFRQQFETSWVGYRVTFTFQLSNPTPAVASDPAPSGGDGSHLPEGPIPVEPDGGIGTGGEDLTPLLDGLQDMMDGLVSDPIEVDPDGTGGNPTELVPGTLTFEPIPVEPNGGIGDGATPLPTVMAFGPIPVEPNGGIGDGAGPIPGAQSPGGFWVPVGPVSFATGTDQTYGDDPWKRWSFANDGPTQMGGPDFLAGMPLDLRLSLSLNLRS